MKTRTKALLSVLLATVIGTAVYAGIMLQWQIESQMRIKRSVSIGVFDIDGVTELRFIQWGDLLWETGRLYPEGAPEVTYFIKNTDQMDFYISFVTSGLPANTVFFMSLKRGDKEAFVELPENVIYQFPIVSSLNDPNPLVQFAYMTFRIYVGTNAPFGDFIPTITIRAHDTATG